jgi:hypothetical protein
MDGSSADETKQRLYPDGSRNLPAHKGVLLSAPVYSEDAVSNVALHKALD